MFRRLLNLEISAFRDQLDELPNRPEAADSLIRELLAINRQSYSRGLWNFRAPV